MLRPQGSAGPGGPFLLLAGAAAGGCESFIFRSQIAFLAHFFLGMAHMFVSDYSSLISFPFLLQTFISLPNLLCFCSLGLCTNATKC